MNPRARAGATGVGAAPPVADLASSLQTLKAYGILERATTLVIGEVTIQMAPVFNPERPPFVAENPHRLTEDDDLQFASS